MMNCPIIFQEIIRYLRIIDSFRRKSSLIFRRITKIFSGQEYFRHFTKLMEHNTVFLLMMTSNNSKNQTKVSLGNPSVLIHGSHYFCRMTMLNNSKEHNWMITSCQELNLFILGLLSLVKDQIYWRKYLSYQRRTHFKSWEFAGI